jgi:23S rRNA pseudouridine2457 synthase
LTAHRYFLLNKPYDMVSQFTSPDNVRLLGDVGFPFPEGTHAIGRLDSTSEGLLILTTNKKITRLMHSGEKKHERTYLVMVQNKMTEETLESLKNGVLIPVRDGKPYKAKPELVSIVADAKTVYAHASDHREQFPHTWLLITLTEGKFRQVRKMVMAVRHRCLRLIRVSIGDITIGNMLPGEVIELEEHVFFEMLGLVRE